MKSAALARWLCLCAGGLDTFTGVGLILMPSLTLRLMGAGNREASTDIFLRFVGVFVAAVGLNYLWALAHGAERMRTVLEFTLLFRLAAGLFTTWAISTQQLGSGWWPVPVTDLLLAALQLGLLRALSLRL